MGVKSSASYRGLFKRLETVTLPHDHVFSLMSFITNNELFSLSQYVLVLSPLWNLRPDYLLTSPTVGLTLRRTGWLTISRNVTSASVCRLDPFLNTPSSMPSVYIYKCYIPYQCLTLQIGQEGKGSGDSRKESVYVWITGVRSECQV
jgi:hypothetical protein